MGTRGHGVRLGLAATDTQDRERARSERLTHDALAVCDAVGAFIEVWGFRAIHGRVWTYLALQARPVAQAEIAEVLGVSRSLVSLAISELQGFGLVRPTSAQRQSPWEASLDVWPTITDVLRGREWMLVERARVALEALVADAEFAREQGFVSPFDPSRARLLLSLTELAQAGLRAVLAVRAPATLEGLGDWLDRVARFARHLPRL